MNEQNSNEGQRKSWRSSLKNILRHPKVWKGIILFIRIATWLNSDSSLIELIGDPIKDTNKKL